MVLRSILESAKPLCMDYTASTFEERMFFVKGEEESKGFPHQVNISSLARGRFP